MKNSDQQYEALALYLEMNEYLEHRYTPAEIAGEVTKRLGKTVSRKTVEKWIEVNAWRERWREVVKLASVSSKQISTEKTLDENLEIIARNAVGKLAKRIKSDELKTADLIGLLKLGLENRQETEVPDLNEFEGIFDEAGR